MNDLHDLTVILKSRFPLVVVESHEEQRALGLLERIANLEGLALFTWTVTSGIRRVGRTDVIPGTSEPPAALRHIDKTPQNGVYVLLDFHPYLQDPIQLRQIREIALEYPKVPRTLVFLSPKLDLPPELARMSARFSLSVLDAGGVRQLMKEEAELWRSAAGGEPLRGQREVADAIAQHLAGMSLEDARRLVRQAIRDDSRLTQDDLARILKLKHESVAAHSLLRLELDTGSFADVGGLKRMKRWLDLRRKAFLGEAPGLEPPRGVLMLGVQGSGKSLAAKAVAGVWGVPLLAVDFGALYNKFFGETERNLREALQAAEAMAPCVLWMDEIEKGVAADGGGEADGGVSRRVLGTLLTWMSERKRRVFLVATANDISRLPPELVRKGRFDEIFFVDLPDAETRAEIFRIHLGRRKLDPDKFDLQRLVELSEGFSGAEIEQAVVSALYEAHALDRPLDTQTVADELARTRPLSVTMAERIDELRAWAAERTVPAH
jgi:SpoVK/Ycf46/Vps4 family AAA+-type ATPase